MTKIVIRAKDGLGDTVQYIKMTSPTLAEMVFYGLTHDDCHQDVDWELIVDGTVINWHYPKR